MTVSAQAFCALMLMQMDPDNPYAYIKALSKQSENGEFDITKKAKGRFYASQKRLNLNKVINDNEVNRYA